MTDSTLYYFVDTNLFLQCRPLEQLDWSAWESFEEVRLIVSKPVLREIDHRKNRGNDRAGRRARDTTSMIRKMLTCGERVVHCSNPRVVLCVESQHQYCEDLKDQLNYDERDDQLVGTAYEFARRNEKCTVRLLTHDTNPMFTASSVGLMADQILDNWLLLPEPTDMEKKLALLQDENARLKKAEPCITIRFLDQFDSQVAQYEHTRKRFDPLTNEQIDELIRRLRAYFPLANNFGGPAELQKRITSHSIMVNQSIADILGKREVFTPATAAEILKYREQTYPQWLEQCEQTLRQYHLVLQEQIPVLEFCFVAENVGTRPATHGLVTIEAFGSFQIMPPPFEEKDGQAHANASETKQLESGKLPPPPDPPTGRLQTIRGMYDLAPVSHAWRQLAAGSRNLEMLTNHSFALPPKLTPRDRNKFYYKPERPSEPQQSFSLECEQWRHGDGEQDFLGEIHASSDSGAIEGRLVCRIHASNLSKPVSQTIPVRVNVVHVSAFESAQTMVESMRKLKNLRPN